MDINDLKIFLTVAEVGKARIAAEMTNHSRGAVYRSIKRLENEFGYALFNHNKYNNTLNEYGYILKEAAPGFIDAQEHLLAKLKSVRVEGDALKIATCDPGPAWFMGKVMAPFLTRGIESHVFRDFDNALSMLKGGIVDILIVAKPVHEYGLTSQFIARDKLYLSVDIADERFKDVREISLSDKRIDHLLYYYVYGAFSKQLDAIYEKLPKSTKLIREEEYWDYHFHIMKKNIITTTTRLVVNYREDGLARNIIPVTDAGTDINYYKDSQHENPSNKNKIIRQSVIV
ncbi:MAG: LysR family transcriptional regulator [Phascolarctobacterium sp.]|nr:LysR family transcriptional regulator [Phascolarctobacterium sp.]